MRIIKNRNTVAKNSDGTYSVTHFTFDNGNTVDHWVRTGLTRNEAYALKHEADDL